MSKKTIDEKIREEKERILRDVVELTPAKEPHGKVSIRWKPRFSTDAFVPEGQKRLRPLDMQTYYDLQLSRGASRPINSELDWEFSSPEEGIHTRLAQNNERFEHLKKYLEISGPMRMLEIGTRDAQWLYFLAEKGFKNTMGVDCVRMNVLWCQKNGFDVVEADAHQVANFFEPASFNLIFAYHVLEHCYEPEQVMQQVFILLKDGGIFHVESPIANYDPQTAHVYSFENGEMADLLLKTGFHLIHTKVINSAERIIARKKIPV
jgi:2-polyprenyl-3-methyl-5-hydroxy-6-metoxy-1,4-benzoquinol methylase